MVADASKKPTPDEPSGGQGTRAPDATDAASVSVLGDPHHTRADCRMVERAVRRGWNIPAATKDIIKERLVGIVTKESVSVVTANGTLQAEAPADTNSIAAARVLVKMDEIDQADDHLAMKTERLDTGQPTENVVIAIPPPIIDRIERARSNG